MTIPSSTLPEFFWTANVKILCIAVTRNAPKNPPSNDFLGKGHNHPAKIRFLNLFNFQISKYFTNQQSRKYSKLLNCFFIKI